MMTLTNIAVIEDPNDPVIYYIRGIESRILSVHRVLLRRERMNESLNSGFAIKLGTGKTAVGIGPASSPAASKLFARGSSAPVIVAGLYRLRK